MACSCTGRTTTRTWYRYHHMFAEFLRRRLERDRPDEVDELHRDRVGVVSPKITTSMTRWITHWLPGDPARAVDLVERDGTYLPERSKMTTLLEIVKKLPPQPARFTSPGCN